MECNTNFVNEFVISFSIVIGLGCTNEPEVWLISFYDVYEVNYPCKNTLRYVPSKSQPVLCNVKMINKVSCYRKQ